MSPSKSDKPFFRKAKYKIHFRCRCGRGLRGFAGWLRRLSSIETLDENGCFGDETTATFGLLSRVESSVFKGLCFGPGLDLLKISSLCIYCVDLRVSTQQYYPPFT